jgi:hypothetical protein
MIATINIDIYLNCVIIAAGIDEKEFDRLYYDNVTKITDDEYKAIRKDIADKSSCDGLTTTLDCGNVFVFIRKGRERYDLTVAHELYHATNRVLMRAGVLHDEHDEPYAYLLAWLTNEYYNRLDDYENGNAK